MTKEILLAQMGLTEEQLHEKITEVAVGYANVAQTANLHPAFAIDASLRYVASMIWSIVEAGGGEQSLVDEMLSMFKAGLDSYMVEIRSQREAILAGASAVSVPALTEYVA